MHERFGDLLPLEINRYGFLGKETVETKTAGLSETTAPPANGNDVERLGQMLMDIKAHSELDYQNLMHDFKISQQELARRSHADALQAVTDERDDIAAQYSALFGQQSDIHVRYTLVCMLVLIICHKEHAEVLETFCKAALEADDKRKQELAAKDELLGQVRTEHQAQLIAKDQSARQKERESRRMITKVTSTYQAAKEQSKSDAMKHDQEREAAEAAFAVEKAKYEQDFNEVGKEMDELHAKEIDKLKATHAAEKRRLQQHPHAARSLQLREAEAGLRLVVSKVRPAMKGLAKAYNAQSRLLQDHFDFSKELWQSYLELCEKLVREPSQRLADNAEVYLGLDVFGEKTRGDIFFPILDMPSLLGFFDLPGARQTGDPPRLTALAWGAMDPAVDAPVETFIEWLVEEDFPADVWTALRQLAYKLARVGSPYDIRRILAKCHQLRRSNWDRE